MYSELSPILAPAGGSAAQAAAYILGRPSGEYNERDIAQAIVPAYVRLCGAVGVDPIIAIAQLLHETGNLTSFWAARPQRNPAGIGVTGERADAQPAGKPNWSLNTQRGAWEFGVSFASWEGDAIPAHIGRLLAYAIAPGQENDAQRVALAKGLSYRPFPQLLRGTAPAIKQLGKVHNPAGQGWASPGDQYGAKIAEIANRIVGGAS